MKRGCLSVNGLGIFCVKYARPTVKVDALFPRSVMQFKLAVVCLIFCNSSLMVAQAPACPTGTMADVVGTTCTIGNLSFTFTTDFAATSTTNAGPELITT